VQADVGLRTGLPVGSAPRTDSRERGARRAVGVAILLVVVTAAWGLWLDSRGRGIALGAAPLAGDYRLTLSPWVVLPLALGAGVVRWGSSVARRAGWRTVLWASLGATALWAVALALVEAPRGSPKG
jgi:di/tricarboxylate transporter